MLACGATSGNERCGWSVGNMVSPRLGLEDGVEEVEGINEG